MDTSQYLEMFISECRELLEGLNLAMLQLEERPDDAGVISEVFRFAHSFKGSAGTMGFTHMEQLTHEMEHVLDQIRNGSSQVDQRTITVLLECLDVLEASVASIEDAGIDLPASPELFDRLHSLLRAEGDGASDGAGAGAAAPTTAGGELLAVPEGVGEPVLRVVVRIDPGCPDPSIRAYMALSALSEVGELVLSEPTPDDALTWEDFHVQALLVTGDLPDDVHAAMLAISEVVAAEVVELDEHGTPTGASAGIDAAAVEAAAAVAATAGAQAGAGVAAEPDPAHAPDSAGAAPASTIILPPSVHAPVAASTAPPAVPPAPADAAPAGAAPTPPPTAGSGISRRKASGTVRVDAERLDMLMHVMGEVIVHRTSVEQAIKDADLAAATESMAELRRSSQMLQTEVMRVRMVPVEASLMRIPRLVRDLATELGKDVKLDMRGMDTEIDRSVVDALSEPIVHLVRNSLDHGIEAADEREAAGKPRQATLSIEARHAGGSVVIEVRDDGRGIHPDKIARRAVERGLIQPEEEASVTVERAIELLFTAGFSTAEKTTNISGRGVGMDAVREMCREWGGDVAFRSVPGVSTDVDIRIPLSLAIMTVLLVTSDDQTLAIPIDRVERTIRLRDYVTSDTAHLRAVVLDDQTLELVHLGRAVGFGSTGSEDYGVVIMGRQGRKVLGVSSLVGEYETVTKPLPPSTAQNPAFMGASVTADGSVVLICNCDVLDGSVARGGGNNGGAGSDPAPRSLMEDLGAATAVTAPTT